MQGKGGERNIVHLAVFLVSQCFTFVLFCSTSRKAIDFICYTSVWICYDLFFVFINLLSSNFKIYHSDLTRRNETSTTCVCLKPCSLFCASNLTFNTIRWCTFDYFPFADPSSFLSYFLLFLYFVQLLNFTMILPYFLCFSSCNDAFLRSYTFNYSFHLILRFVFVSFFFVLFSSFSLQHCYILPR